MSYSIHKSTLEYQGYLPYRWQENYWRALQCVARFYSIRDSKTPSGYKGFVFCFLSLLPDRLMSEKLVAFTKGQGVETLPSIPDLKGFFSVYQRLADQIRKNPGFLWNTAFETSENLFIFVYLLQQYWNNITGQPVVSWNQYDVSCNKENIDKASWSRPMWFVIHTTAANAPDKIPRDWGYKFKDMIWCMQWALPCSVCRKHLSENLGSLPIDNSLNTRSNLFEWTWKLHNLVNEETGSPSISLHEAEQMYMH